MAYLRNTVGLALTGFTDSGHQVPMDTKKVVGGLETAASPMELVLQALMGCTAMDVISILKKMKVDYDDLVVEESHVRSEEHPMVYQKIHLTYRFAGEGLDEEKLKKAVSLSKESYCPVAAMLKGSVELTHEIQVNGVKVD